LYSKCTDCRIKNIYPSGESELIECVSVCTCIKCIPFRRIGTRHQFFCDNHVGHSLVFNAVFCRPFVVFCRPFVVFCRPFVVFYRPFVVFCRPFVVFCLYVLIFRGTVLSVHPFVVSEYAFGICKLF
jgi:hypothetical protein